MCSFGWPAKKWCLRLSFPTEPLLHARFHSFRMSATKPARRPLFTCLIMWHGETLLCQAVISVKVWFIRDGVDYRKHAMFTWNVVLILLTGVSVRKYQFFVQQKRSSCKHKEMLTRLTVFNTKFESLFMANLAKAMNDQSNCCNGLFQRCNCCVIVFVISWPLVWPSQENI